MSEPTFKDKLEELDRDIYVLSGLGEGYDDILQIKKSIRQDLVEFHRLKMLADRIDPEPLFANGFHSATKLVLEICSYDLGDEEK